MRSPTPPTPPPSSTNNNKNEVIRICRNVSPKPNVSPRQNDDFIRRFPMFQRNSDDIIDLRIDPPPSSTGSQRHRQQRRVLRFEQADQQHKTDTASTQQTSPCPMSPLSVTTNNEYHALDFVTASVTDLTTVTTTFKIQQSPMPTVPMHQSCHVPFYNRNTSADSLDRTFASPQLSRYGTNGRTNGNMSKSLIVSSGNENNNLQHYQKAPVYLIDCQRGMLSIIDY